MRTVEDLRCDMHDRIALVQLIKVVAKYIDTIIFKLGSISVLNSLTTQWCKIGSSQDGIWHLNDTSPVRILLPRLGEFSAGFLTGKLSCERQAF